jgi:hypothetical protein
MVKMADQTIARRFRFVSSVPDPGPLPTRPQPAAGETLLIRCLGLPPHKDGSFSIRNPLHPHHQRFADLRAAAIEAMAGRAPYLGPIELDLHIVTKNFRFKSYEHLGGVMDTLDGAHAKSFTYLPIVFQDDCQVYKATVTYGDDNQERYHVGIVFLKLDDDQQ